MMPQFGPLSASDILCREHRGRLLCAIAGVSFVLIAGSQLLQSSGVMLLALFAMPGVLYQIVYSQANPPKSKSLWSLFLLTSMLVYFIFTMFSLFARNDMGIAEIAVVSLLTVFAMNQIRFLFRVRRQMRQSAVEVCDWN